MHSELGARDQARQRRGRNRASVGVLSALALFLSACGGASPQSSAPEPTGGAPANESSTDAAATNAQAGSEVLLENIAFKPSILEVAVGTEVTWTNADEGVAHTVTSGEAGANAAPGVTDAKPNKPDGVFDGDLPDAGDTFSFTFEEAGTYPYFCEIHPSMTGEITVE